MSVQPLQLARIGTLFQTGMVQTQVNSIQKQLADVEQQLSTGKSITAPSQNPADAAVAMQLQKTLDQRQAYAANLNAGQSQLGEVDNTLSSLNAILQQAQSIASANVGSDVTDQQRQAAASVVDSLFSQALSLANTQFDGTYLFAGDKSTAAPFVENSNGVKFVGSTNLLQNTVDDNMNLTFMVNGAQVFGGLSSQVQSQKNLSPNLTPDTQIADLNGTLGNGVHLGPIVLGNGTDSTTVDLSKAVSIQDVVNDINAAGIGGITASITGQGVTLSGNPTDDISVQDVTGGSTAADLGILTSGDVGAGNPVGGGSVSPRITGLTPLSALAGGAPLDLTSGLTITTGAQSVTVSFANANNVQDLLNAINSSGAQVTAQINAAGTGIDILNATQGAPMTISENGGTTAADLGVQSFGPSTQLSELNNGKGVGTAKSGADFTIKRSDGTSFDVSLAGAQTVQDVIDAINTADAGKGVTAGFASGSNGIVLTDNTAGAGTLTITADNSSTAVADLGLTQPASGNTITGDDVNPISSNGIFSNLAALRDALNSGDQAAITTAGGGLADDQNRVITTRGVVGAKVQEIESRQTNMSSENIATQSLLSNLTDTDFTTAVTRFQSLQQSLQASLESAANVMNLSLLDFLT